MPSLLIVEHQPINDTVFGLSDTVVGVEIKLLAFQAAPEALNKIIIHVPSLTLHADFDPFVFLHSGKIFTSKLTTLVAVEYLRLALGCQRVVKYLDTRSGIQRVGLSPR
ncbi:MAG: hypothetical protein P8P22_02320 [Porticoccaceae bacterium]|nr:hypothetical protein [Porticoccaceae bacterium]